MMHIITILLCILANQVVSQTNDISPAKILAHQKTISENSDLFVTCSTFGRKKDSMIFVYLLKNGLGIMKLAQKQDRDDTTFHISRVGLSHSGNYSCVYSQKNYTVSKVTEKGYNSLQILVIANFLPADISVAGPSVVQEGDYVEFRCSVSGPLHTLNECQLIYSYLRKNETILQVQAFNVIQMQATFKIEGAVMRDSGHYSCIVLPSVCLNEQEYTLHGKNNVYLDVKVDWLPRVLISFGMIALIILICLCLWWILTKKGRSALYNPCASGQQTNADFLEEQREQTQGEDLEAQDDSFSMEDDEECQNMHAAEDSAYSNSCDGLYSVVDESGDEYDDIDRPCAK